MLNAIIAFSLKNRLLVLAAVVLVGIAGVGIIATLPVDVFPDLNRPTVTIMTEAPGLVPEEVELQVTLPIERVMNGATGVLRVRSASGIGLSVVWVESEWGSDIYRDRQIVNEKLQLVVEQLPEGVRPVMAPISSIMGEIMLVGLSSADGTTSPLELRTLAEWEVRPRLLAIAGVSQVTTMGGGLQQIQVLTSPERLAQHEVTLEELADAVSDANRATGAGFILEERSERLIRITGRTYDPEGIARAVVLSRDGVSVRVGDVATIGWGHPVKRGDGGVDGGTAVILSIQKQPEADTRVLTDLLDEALRTLRATLPPDVRVHDQIFRQREFIDAAIGNVEEAIRDGGILVMVVLFLFLWNLRTSLITLTAIPLSMIMTAFIFRWLGISINTMTLGGLAVAIGELVDDSIVDVENIFRRLKENRHKAQPEPVLKVVYLASCEVRNSIVYATMILVVVCFPLFYLGGLEGRMFLPLGLAYVLTLVCSLLVSLTVTPVLSSYLLPRAKIMAQEEDAFLLRWLKRVDRKVLEFTLRHPLKILGLFAGVSAVSFLSFLWMGGEFLPPFNEGTYTVNLRAAPGTSLAESNRIGQIAEKRLLGIPEVLSTARRAGRAELDEHAEGVNNTEIEVRMRGDGVRRSREEIVAAVRDAVSNVPGVAVNIGQPISHRLDHMMSGIRAQVAVKIYGNDLATLRELAAEVHDEMAQVRGVVDLAIEPQVEVPELRIEKDEAALARYGVRWGDVVDALETALRGAAVSQVLDGQLTYDVVVWYDEASRNSLDAVRQTLVRTSTGASVPLEALARVYDTTGPNTINRENVTRRIVVSCNVAGRDLASSVEEMRDRVGENVTFPQGYFPVYGGQFESQQQATRTIVVFGSLSVVAVFLLLYKALGTWQAALQCMANLPMAAVGGVIAIFLTDRTLSVASLVGFITLVGIVTRNGIMMISHYVHLMQHEGERFDEKMIIRGSLERLAPVLMTAFTTVVGLVPLALGVGETGKEILHPLAIVVIGGLLSSTLLDQVVTPALFFKFGRKAYEGRFDRKLEERIPDSKMFPRDASGDAS